VRGFGATVGVWPQLLGVPANLHGPRERRNEDPRTVISFLRSARRIMARRSPGIRRRAGPHRGDVARRPREGSCSCASRSSQNRRERALIREFKKIGRREEQKSRHVWPIDMTKLTYLCLTLCVLSGCARMHHYEMGEIDASEGRLTEISVQVDETGLDSDEAVEAAKLLAQDKQTRERLNTLKTILALSQFGPKTGDPTTSDDWADGLLLAVLERCPSGHVTGLTVIRESMDYPIVSGEIVTVKGFCVR
jgi:hypothetical protein